MRPAADPGYNLEFRIWKEDNFEFRRRQVNFGKNNG
jgi:hypothetical protein